MEFSSPLAAMRPQPCPSWPSRRDLPSSRSVLSAYNPYGPNSFDFRSMSMQQQRPIVAKDYFTSKPLRGSSPTSSLTADLDANFHIDKSPQVVTPRRALFTANVIKPTHDHARVATPPVEIEIERATTPNISSSSPGIDMMDVSPLPHKAPYFVAKVTLPSPTPEESPEEAIVSPDLLLSAELLPTPQPPTFLQLPERKRPVTRPSLSRAKGWSTNNLPQRPFSAETELPPFRFGDVVASNPLASSSTPSLMESFTESPIDLPSSLSCTMLPPPPPLRRPSIGSASRLSGSPSGGHVRKSSNGRPPFTRPPRKQMRRSLSMFQHPDDVMKEEQDPFDKQPALMSMMELEPDNAPRLPHFIPDSEPDSLPRISQDTMVDVLNQKYSSHFDNIVIIDCRFEYEYEGGHIESAVNYNDKQLLSDKLFAEPPSSPASTLLIFHCEYSVHRAPLTAKFIRNHDRKINAANYPSLSYPEMYILDGGYSRFFSEHRSKCHPQNYVEMNDTRHEQACERGMAKVKQRQKLFRHQTFAFGQSMDDSPTQAQGRGLGPRSHSTFDVGPAIAAGIGLEYQRRMASY